MDSAKAIRSIVALTSLLAVMWVHTESQIEQSLTLAEAIERIEQNQTMANNGE
jgi:hypothetical protein